MAKSVDRNKYKASKVDVFLDADAGHSFGQGGRPGYLNISDGFNLFRLYPSHDPETSWIYPKTVSWLPAKVTDKQSKQTEIKQKPIFNAKTHAGWEKDLVEEYIDRLRAKFQKKYSSKKEVSDAMAPVYDNKNRTAINPKWSWVVYADKLKGADIKGDKKQFGRLEIKASMKKKMNVLCASEDIDDPIETDPFTDPDTGLPIEVTKNTDLEPQEMYALKLKSDFYKEGKDKGKVKFYPLTDEDLEAFEKVEPLFEQFQNCFTKEDFDAQVVGLEIFDKKNKFDLFKDPDFIEVLEELTQWSESLSSRVEKKEDAEDPDDEKDEVAETDEDKFSDMDRKTLKQFIAKEKLGIVVVASMSDDDIRERIREAVADVEEPEEETEEPPFIPTKKDKKEVDKNIVKKSSSFRDRLKK